MQPQEEAPELTYLRPKPLLRGWFHAGAAVGALLMTTGICWRSWDDGPRLVSLLVFGLSNIALYTVSAIYHIGSWHRRGYRVLHSFDHANIFLVIAGSYTPICFNVLTDGLRLIMLSLIWVLAAAGSVVSIITIRLPRGLSAGLYIGMGWLAVLLLPIFATVLPWPPIVLLVAGGLCYTAGAIIYTLRRPDPFPRVFGFHEIFHLFVVAGGTAVAATIWFWVVPFPRS